MTMLGDKLKTLNQNLENNISRIKDIEKKITGMENQLSKTCSVIEILNKTNDDFKNHFVENINTISEQNKLISLFEITISDQANYINQLNASIHEQADIIDQFQLTIDEQVALINLLDLTIQDQASLIITAV